MLSEAKEPGVPLPGNSISSAIYISGRPEPTMGSKTLPTLAAASAFP